MSHGAGLVGQKEARVTVWETGLLHGHGGCLLSQTGPGAPPHPPTPWSTVSSQGGYGCVPFVPPGPNLEAPSVQDLGMQVAEPTGGHSFSLSFPLWLL
jgi:hypothetical protein